MLTEATARNIARKAHWADHVQLVDGKPLFSWLDLSITELCNRSAGSPNACVFCPRIDPSTYPNQNLHMSLPLAEKIAVELHDLKYEGAVVLSGFGEPLLHPRLEELVRPFRGLRLEIVTNGDRLRPDKISCLVEAGISYFVVSLYDGPHQVNAFELMFNAAGVGKEMYGLRDRWHGPETDYGLKLTNRAGTIDAGHQPPINATARCFYPSYTIAVDWNGDVLLCVQDWNKRMRFGNLNAVTLLQAWHDKRLHMRRKQLIMGNRGNAPCNACNAEGTLHGTNHAEGWGG